jgi:hypothetical protein
MGPATQPMPWHSIGERAVGDHRELRVIASQVNLVYRGRA